MSSSKSCVTFVVPGDLHLTHSDQPNFDAAVKIVGEINRLIKPHFVQFIGDNVQDADENQFHLFNELHRSLDVPAFALVGDHDSCGDALATVFRSMVGKTYGSSVINGVRFVRLNTLEIPRLGFSEHQLSWLHQQFVDAREWNEKVVVFQHHYPYKVCEDFDGPGIATWRELITAYRPAAIICGHTHYWQVANDGHQISIAVRSIGDPEGGPPGYLIAHLEGDDLAVIYRTIEDKGPAVMITRPRDELLAVSSQHVICGDDTIRARVWSTGPIDSVTAEIDEESSIELHSEEESVWTAPLDQSLLQKGVHKLRVTAQAANGQTAQHEIHFRFDASRRFTATPSVAPVVQLTAFC